MGYRRWAERVGFLGTSGGILASGALQGLFVLSVRVDLAFVVVGFVLLNAILSSVMFSAFVGVSGAIFGVKLAFDRRAAESRETGEDVTAIVPVYEDAAALDRSVRSLCATAYENLSVVVVCEPDDRASRERAEQLADRYGVDVLVNDRRPGSKAGAVNYAVDATESAYVAVFDADEVVHPQFVGHAVARLAECDVVQGRTVPEPTGWVEELAYNESVLLSYVARRLLYLVTGFRMASSRAVVMRRSAFERVGGYDPRMLTEDFDFAYRCYRAGLDVRETLAYPSRIEAAHSMRDWWGQRKRWMTGYVQVLHRLAHRIDPTDYRSVLSPLVCAVTVAGSALTLSLLSKFAILLVADAEVWFLPPVVAVAAVTLGARVADHRTVGVGRPGLSWLLTPVLFPLYGLTTIKAVFEYLFTWDGDWYSVEKL